MKKQAEHFGAEYMHGTVVEADLSKRPFRLNVDGEWHEARTLIVASGASARWLGLPNEQKLIGHGVSSCATCDGFFYRGKKIMVIGGGDSAMEEANFLTRFGQRSRAGASPRCVPRFQDHAGPRAQTIPRSSSSPTPWSKTSTTSPRSWSPAVKLRNIETGEIWDATWTASSSPSDTSPTPSPSRARSRLDPDGYIVSKGGARTNIAGVFHAGDVQDRIYRQAITAAGAGCMAAIEVERFLEAHEH